MRAHRHSLTNSPCYVSSGGSRLTTLSHHMDLNWMCEAYRQVRKNAATGIDGQTVAQYSEHIVENP